jgi:hypothetical protein
LQFKTGHDIIIRENKISNLREKVIMRVKFKNSIYSCTKVTHTTESRLLLFTTTNGVYSVDLCTARKAEMIYDQMLFDGYCDVSEFEYSN